MPHSIYYIFHLLFVVPLFLYIGIKRDETPDAVFSALGAMAVGVLGYHGFRAYSKLTEGKSAWVNWIHIFLVVPLLALLAFQRKNTSRKYFELLMMLGFAAAGYHGYYLIVDH